MAGPRSRVTLLLLLLIVGIVIGAGAASSMSRTVVLTTTQTWFTATTVVQRDVLEVCFSRTEECDRLIISLIERASSSVLVAVFSFTSDPLAEALINAHRKGITVRVLVERLNANQTGSEYMRLRNSGLDVKLDGNSNSMHHKFVVIDGTIVITGSYNFSRAAEAENDENVVVINDAGVARSFTSEFERMWAIAR
ncbi:MAG: phospholipase D family protein [Aigarchaeota archaeon]|nr:phospholipase D family protein [Aigarchaeota archaeon]MDW8093074.1 phospholipase D family protein [Nitrososphaerota archaeon]